MIWSSDRLANVATALAPLQLALAASAAASLRWLTGWEAIALHFALLCAAAASGFVALALAVAALARGTKRKLGASIGIAVPLSLAFAWFIAG